MVTAPREAAAPRKRATKKVAPRRKPARFGAKGLKLWNAHKDDVIGEHGLVLLEEACRIADRLDKLDALLKGDPTEWGRVLPTKDGEGFVLHVDGALVEARQQANVLRQVVAALPMKEPADDVDDGAWVDGV